MPRNARNPVKIGQAKVFVLSLLNTVNLRYAGKLSTDLSVEEGTYMDCNAKVFEGGDEAVSEGAYDATQSTHAEMNALVKYIAQETDFETIDRIEISSPPCKSCAIVLELLGVIDKVKTTKDIYKNATGSWKWPAKLKDPQTFDQTQWDKIRAAFADSGLSDNEILEETVKVIQNQSSN